MRKTLFTAALFTVFLAGIVNAQEGWLTRYWDGCKPSCSWQNNGTKVCDINNNLIPNHPNNAGTSSCDGGAQFTCWDMIPWVDASDRNLAYGFVATTPPNNCGACWEITFTGSGHYGNNSQHAAIRGKRMIVMATNIGGDVGGQQLDLLIPGGGLGLFDSFTRQTGISTSALGARYGGLLEDCERESNYNASTYKSCLTNKCNTTFSNARHATLREGCLFLANWLEAAGNPRFTRRSVTCPAELTRRYREAVGGGGTQPTTHTITYNVNGGTGTAPATQTVNAGVSVTLASGSGLTRSGFTFGGWNTSANGSGTNYAAGASFTPTANVTLFARWTANATNHTITFNVNGGNALNPSTATTQANGTLASLPTPTRSGHTFNGWFTAATGGTAITASTVFNNSATIFAQWTATPTTFTVTFNVNGGNALNPSTAATGTNGRLTSLPTPTRSGHTFNGWFTAATGGTEVTTNTVFTANTTIFARWTAAAFTITYNINGGTGTTPAVQTVNSGSSVTLASNSGFTRSGFTFNGWNTNAQGTGTNFNAGASFTPTVSITLYARWVPATTPTSYTVTYNINGGTGTTPAVQTVNAGSSVTLASGSGITRSGFTFEGWNTNAQGTGTNFNAGVSFTPTANTTLFARWAAVSAVNYTVTYNANGGTGTAPAAQTVSAGSAVTVASGSGLTRSGFTFDGWNTDLSGMGTDHGAGSAFTPASDVTLYAKWTAAIVTPGGKDTIKVEAESLNEAVPRCVSNQNNPMCIGVSSTSGITNIGFISTGDVATYTVDIPRAGTYTMAAMLAVNQADVSSSGFTVTVNGTQVGTLTTSGTGAWNRYQIVEFGPELQLSEGNNTIRLVFSNSVNLDYFLLIGESAPVISVRYGGARVSKTPANIVLRPVNRGFTAALPNNHGFESYSLVDLQGREIRKGTVQSGASELYFSNIRQSVLFLRLKGKNGTTVLKATTF
ncbi:MAG: InlB B-repeat-containing protein [Chitinispirillia bacterium]|nr:InlB B-repeat-containing protein [Chitinispirillia bacterium]